MKVKLRYLCVMYRITLFILFYSHFFSVTFSRSCIFAILWTYEKDSIYYSKTKIKNTIERYIRKIKKKRNIEYLHEYLWIKSNSVFFAMQMDEIDDQINERVLHCR